MLELMVFMVLFLLAFIVMYFYLLKKINSNYQELSEDHAQLRVILRAVESQLNQIECKTETEEQEASTSEGEIDPNAGYDPLLHLSFEEPPTPEKDFTRKK